MQQEDVSDARAEVPFMQLDVVRGGRGEEVQVLVFHQIVEARREEDLK